MAPSTQAFQGANASSLSPEQLSGAEKLWVSYQPYLLSQGYQLRPRYRPGWVPSWIETGQDPYDCEDSVNSMPVRTLDALRLKDSAQVMIKMIIPPEDDREGVEELEIVRKLSSEPYLSDPANHTVRCLDSFATPDVKDGMFYVMPLLMQYDEHPFYNLHEIRDFLAQIFEGLQFLHNNDIAHCDIASSNILMDGRALYDEPFHPFDQHLTLDGSRLLSAKYTRSQVGMRYYYIDFGYAKWFHSPDEPRLVTGSRARERAPEQLAGEPYDPFRIDIYQLGAVLRRDLIPKNPLIRFLLPLAQEMTRRDPNVRPTLQQAHRMMDAHFAGLQGWRMRWPIIPHDASSRQRFTYVVTGVATEIMFCLRSILRMLLLVRQ